MYRIHDDGIFSTKTPKQKMKCGYVHVFLYLHTT